VSGDFPFSLPRAGHARRSSQTCPTRRAIFLARMSVRDARVYTCTRCAVHDKLSCTRLQNYTIGASLMSVSVSVSVQWNSMHNTDTDILATILTSVSVTVSWNAALPPLLRGIFASFRRRRRASRLWVIHVEGALVEVCSLPLLCYWACMQWALPHTTPHTD